MRSAKNARAAAIAPAIGAPSMLFDASMRRRAPLGDPPGGATFEPDYRATVLGDVGPLAVGGRVCRSAKQVGAVGEAGTRGLGELELPTLPGAATGVGAASAASRARGADADEVSHAVAPRRSSSEATLSNALRELDAALAELLEEDGRRPVERNRP